MKFEYPSELPVSAARSDIAEAVRSSQVVIVSGQTGSGKTTQLPKILLNWAVDRMAGRSCTRSRAGLPHVPSPNESPAKWA